MEGEPECAYHFRDTRLKGLGHKRPDIENPGASALAEEFEDCGSGRRNTCTVPESLETTRSEESEEKATQDILAGLFPLRKVTILFARNASKRRITVPLRDAVAINVPAAFTAIAANWAL